MQLVFKIDVAIGVPQPDDAVDGTPLVSQQDIGSAQKPTELTRFASTDRPPEGNAAAQRPLFEATRLMEVKPVELIVETTRCDQVSERFG